MEVKIKKVGIKDNFLYMVEKIDDYYFLWVIEKVPVNLKEETLQEFISAHDTEGDSTTGSYQQIMKELKVFLQPPNIDSCMSCEL